ncbi:MAG: hypothetical protein KDA37_17025 [Planctomycetales bacterium]|nr:hypothetical protein [Planctomycetales bacterium]
MCSPRETLLYVGLCPVCETGPLGVRRCGACGNLSLLCDECDGVWPDAALDQPPLPVEDAQLSCPHCGADLASTEATWATREEVLRSDWLARAISNGRLEIKEAAAFAPKRNEPSE